MSLNETVGRVLPGDLPGSLARCGFVRLLATVDRGCSQ